MTEEHVTLESARLALKLISTDGHADNERAFLTALKAFDDPFDRLGVALHTSRILAGQIRESAQRAGTYEQLLEHVELTLLESIFADQEGTP